MVAADPIVIRAARELPSMAAAGPRREPRGPWRHDLSRTLSYTSRTGSGVRVDGDRRAPGKSPSRSWGAAHRRRPRGPAPPLHDAGRAGRDRARRPCAAAGHGRLRARLADLPARRGREHPDRAAVVVGPSQSARLLLSGPDLVSPVHGELAGVLVREATRSRRGLGPVPQPVRESAG